MFLSKIWFFLIAVAGATALVVALLLPRPAQRERLAEQEKRLVVACEVVNILMRDNARGRIELTRTFAARPGLAEVLMKASGVDSIDEDRATTARVEGKKIIDEMQGTPPDFVLLLDNRGRVVTSIGYGGVETNDSVAGYFVVEDALNGYLRDDLWYLDDTLYRVAAAPVIQRQPDLYAGAVVLGHAIDKDFANSLVGNLSADMAFYVDDAEIASSAPLQISEAVVERFATLRASTEERESDCRSVEPFTVNAGDRAHAIVMARLPGEAGAAGAFYAVAIDRPTALGLMATLDNVKKGDLSFGSFPWIPIGVGMLVVLAAGFALMIFEADKPLRKLSGDAVRLAQGEVDRLDEEAHRAKYGSIARSVNIHIDKLQRETRSAKKDLDQLLGPAPEGGVASALPPVGPGGIDPGFKPPPPSQFKFGGGGASKPAPAVPVEAPSPAFDLDLPPPPSSMNRPAPPPVNKPVPPPPVALPGGAPPPVPSEKTPPPMPRAATPPPLGLDDDILGDPTEEVEDEGPTAVAEAKHVRGDDFDAPTRVADPSQALLDASVASDQENEEGYFRKVFDDFVALKKKCGESTASLTFTKFAGKLRKNRDALIAKHGCKEVKFQVYVKDGKAALKATPLKS